MIPETGRRVVVHLLPALLPERLPDDAACVVIDVLRASTTVVRALEAGAQGVVACETVDEAQRLATRWAAEPGDPRAVLLGGERGGLPIDGFDLGNSPAEYRAEVVAGRMVVFTTTNGTRALAACRGAKRKLLGALVNRGAVVEAVKAEREIHLVCAGTRGEVSREDVLAAGAMVERLLDCDGINGGPSGWQCNDSARIARDTWRQVVGDSRRFESLDRQQQVRLLAAALRETQGGRNLRAIGLDADLLQAARLDDSSCVPCLKDDGVLRPA